MQQWAIPISVCVGCSGIHLILGRAFPRYLTHVWSFDSWLTFEYLRNEGYNIQGISLAWSKFLRDEDRRLLDWTIWRAKHHREVVGYRALFFHDREDFRCDICYDFFLLFSILMEISSEFWRRAVLVLVTHKSLRVRPWTRLISHSLIML